MRILHRNRKHICQLVLHSSAVIIHHVHLAVTRIPKPLDQPSIVPLGIERTEKVPEKKLEPNKKFMASLSPILCLWIPF